MTIITGLPGGAKGPFDLVFVDADKPNNVAYFDWALKLTRRGSLIIADTLVRNGAVADATKHPDGRQQRLRWAYDCACDRRLG